MILFFVLAILGFCASLLVHGSTFLDSASISIGMSRAWPLHLGIFAVFIPAVLSRAKRVAGVRRRSLREEFAHAPRWMLPPFVALGAYAAVNFAMGISLLGGFSGEKFTDRDGKHVAVRDGVVRPVGDAEYRMREAHQARLFSGHWMLFYWAAAVMLADGMRRRTAMSAPSAPSAAGPAPHLNRTGDDRAYTLRPSPRLGPSTHATLIVFVRMLGFFGGFLAVAVPAVSFGNRYDSGVLKNIGCFGFLLILPAALFGAVVPARCVARLLPARCPFCNGRGYCDGATTTGRGAFNFTYACRDCGRVFRPDGSPA